MLYYKRQGERKDNPGKPDGELVQIQRGDAHKPLKKCEKPLDNPQRMCYNKGTKGEGRYGEAREAERPDGVAHESL